MTTTVERTFTLTLSEADAVGLKTLLNFAHVPNGVDGQENVDRVATAIEVVFAALDKAGVRCAYLKAR